MLLSLNIRYQLFHAPLYLPPSLSFPSSTASYYSTSPLPPLSSVELSSSLLPSRPLPLPPPPPLASMAPPLPLFIVPACDWWPTPPCWLHSGGLFVCVLYVDVCVRGVLTHSLQRLRRIAGYESHRSLGIAANTAASKQHSPRRANGYTLSIGWS